MLNIFVMAWKENVDSQKKVFSYEYNFVTSVAVEKQDALILCPENVLMV